MNAHPFLFEDSFQAHGAQILQAPVLSLELVAWTGEEPLPKHPSSANFSQVSEEGVGERSDALSREFCTGESGLRSDVDDSRFERAGRMDCESVAFTTNNLEIVRPLGELCLIFVVKYARKVVVPVLQSCTPVASRLLCWQLRTSTTLSTQCRVATKSTLR